MEHKVVVLACGGTIAGWSADPADNVGYVAGQVPIGEVLSSAGLDGHQLEVETLASIDSKDMDPDLWWHLARRCRDLLARGDVGAILVTHGTDTLEETAFFLDAVVSAGKPVVLVSAMRPASSVHADGPRNLADALIVAADPLSRGVLAVCAGVVHAGRHIRKVHPYRVDAFDSGEQGPLGFVEEGAVRWMRVPMAPESLPSERPWLLRPEPPAWPRVDGVTSHAGADGRIVDGLVSLGVEGLVVAGTGNGTVHAKLAAALRRARAQGVWVWRTTRCPWGEVVAQAADSEFPVARGLSLVQARIALMLARLDAAESNRAPEGALENRR